MIIYFMLLYSCIMLKNLLNDLDKAANSKKAKLLAGFFKTGKGEYGEGDIFLGIMVPEQRSLAKKYVAGLGLAEIQKLMDSKYHEHRLVALFLLIEKYKKGDEKIKKEIISAYLRNAKRGKINNWDLVDLSAPKILGDYLFNKKKDLLYKLARSKSLWERRIAVLATFAFIKEKSFSDSLAISRLLIFDKQDLIHKAVGWMLREIGKRDLKVEVKFLDRYAQLMPRTMLRYAIEKFTPDERQKYLSFKNKIKK